MIYGTEIRFLAPSTRTVVEPDLDLNQGPLPIQQVPHSLLAPQAADARILQLVRINPAL